MPASYGGGVVYGGETIVSDGTGCPPGGCGEVVYEDGGTITTEESTTVEAPEAPAEEATSDDLTEDREA